MRPPRWSGGTAPPRTWRLLGVGSLALVLSWAAPNPAAAQQNKLGGLLAGPASAHGGRPELVELGIELDQLAARSDDKSVQDAVTRARAAILAVRHARAQGQQASAERRLQIAWAALALAQRHLARIEAQVELTAAQRRAARSEQEQRRAEATRADAQRRLLERAQERGAP